jgi:ArsR family transcriptional regulator, lead/cadmium/zinc/bismuth-responsive transcriptional repressor
MSGRSRTVKPHVLDQDIAAHVAELFRVFGDPSRVRILSALISGEVNVGVLATAVGLTESAISHHMRGLRQLRLVRARKEGRQVYYYVNDAHIVALFQQVVKHVQHD